MGPPVYGPVLDPPAAFTSTTVFTYHMCSQTFIVSSDHRKHGDTLVCNLLQDLKVLGSNQALYLNDWLVVIIAVKIKYIAY